MKPEDEKGTPSAETKQDEKNREAFAAWDKVYERERIIKWIMGSCLILGLIIAIIIEVRLRDSLPKILTERSLGKRRRGSLLNLIELLGIGAGWLLGKGISELIIKQRKLEE